MRFVSFSLFLPSTVLLLPLKLISNNLTPSSLKLHTYSSFSSSSASKRLQDMKLLGWMHRKFFQSSNDPFREFTNPPLCNCVNVRPSPEDNRYYVFTPVPEAMRLTTLHEEPPVASSMLFEGLLAIGTFGLPVISVEEEEMAEDQVEEIARKEMEEMTERDLMVVTTELQKALAVGAEKKYGASVEKILSSGPVGSCGKGVEECPLKGFLSGSQVAVAAASLGRERRSERRASLGELFTRSGMVGEDVSVGKGEVLPPAEGKTTEAAQAAGMQGVTKRTRKRCDGGKCNGTDVKVPKIISRIFHRKIHPETTVASKKLKNYSQHHHLEKEKSHTSSNYNNCSTKSKCAAYGTQGKLGISSFKCHSSPPSSAELGMKMAHGKTREHWIKTDADYLVLEL